MQSNIFELIDLLVKMSGSNSNLDELKADLNDTEIKIQETQKELDTLENEMNDDKYFDASSEIVDRNIKISLVKKIQKLNKIKNDIDKELESVKEEELSLHNQLEDLKDEINNANSYNDYINKTENPTEAYTNMIAVENNRITKLINKKENLSDKYEKVQKKVEYLALSSLDMNDKIKKEEERLNEIENNLSNIKSYVDIEAKEEDENKYVTIKDTLDSLNVHKNEIIEDPVYIAGLIKEHIANESKDDVESEFNHLVNIVKSIPFMDLENDEIPVEMEKLNEELKNYDNTISQKEYQTLDSEFIDERISYLEDYLKKIKDRINDYNARIEIINDENDLLSSKIFRAESQIENIDNSLIDYENYDYENNELPKSVVQAANNKLIEEKANIYDIAEKYRADLVLNLKEQKDKIEIKKINKKINDLKNREQYSKSISSILDEFEMLNSSLEFVDKKTRVQRKSKTANEDLEELNINNDNAIEQVEITNINEPIISDDQQVNIPIITDNQEESIILPIEENKPEETDESEKLRVVEVYPISDGDLTEKDEDKNFMVNDFQDDDYVDFETAISTQQEN